MRTRPLKHFIDPSRPLTYGIVQAGPNIDGGVPYVRPVDMTATSGVRDFMSLQRTSGDIASAYRRSTIREGDVVLSIGPSFGKVMVVEAELTGANLTQGTARLAPNASTHPRWLYWAMQSKTATSAWDAIASGGTFRALNLGPLSETEVPLYSATEQRRIAAFLDDRVSCIDNIISARRQQVATERARAAAERDRLVELAVVRGAVKVRHLVRKIEQGWSPQADSTPAEDGIWGVLKSGAVNGGSFRGSENKALPYDLEPKTEYEIHQGDLLMSRASGSLDLIGSVAVVPDGVRSRLLLCDKIYRITPDRGVSPRFLAASLRTSRSRSAIRLGVSGAEGMANSLPSGVIRDLIVPRIAEVEQIELANRVENVERVSDERLRALALSIELLTEYKQSLITAAVTGEFDVTTASTEVPA